VTAAQILRRYRHAHEELRALGASDRPLAPYQISRTAEDLGLDRDLVAATVDEWMVKRPLKYWRWCRRPDLKKLLAAFSGAGLRLGVLSDYAAAVKLDASRCPTFFAHVVHDGRERERAEAAPARIPGRV
jgi:hypothetical protein